MSTKAPDAPLPAAWPDHQLIGPGVVTIMFTDIVESTAMTQRLGDARAHALVRMHDEVVRGALVAFDGAEVKHTGDGIMASFVSVSSAVVCSASIQVGLERRSFEPSVDGLRVRIGLNAGEPIAEDEDYFGASVQLARRVCEHAAGGQVLVSDVVRQLTIGKGFQFERAEPAALRGFAEPVSVYELQWDAGPT
jgi:adenylate cyclase